MSAQLSLIGAPAITPDRGVEGGREALDAYWTPDDCALACVRALSTLWIGRKAPRRILEPSVGGGSWVRAIRAVWGGVPHLSVADLDPDVPGLLEDVDEAIRDDFLSLEIEGIDLIVGNPPYQVLLPWLDRSLRIAPRVAYLLRSTALGSAARLQWWQEHTPRGVWILSPRPRWEGPGGRPESDTCDSVLVVWDRDHLGPPTLAWLGWR